VPEVFTKRSIGVAEAAAAGESIFIDDPENKQSVNYGLLAEVVNARYETNESRPRALRRLTGFARLIRQLTL
jgi:hypothetical protein